MVLPARVCVCVCSFSIILPNQFHCRSIEKVKCLKKSAVNGEFLRICERHDGRAWWLQVDSFWTSRQFRFTAKQTFMRLKLTKKEEVWLKPNSQTKSVKHHITALTAQVQVISHDANAVILWRYTPDLIHPMIFFLFTWSWTSLFSLPLFLFFGLRWIDLAVCQNTWRYHPAALCDNVKRIKYSVSRKLSVTTLSETSDIYWWLSFAVGAERTPNHWE